MQAVEPIIRIGTKFDISGHKAKVSAILRDGVQCELGDKKFVVPFEQIETALKQYEKEEAKVEEKSKKRKNKK
jgi:hypothetical protein